MIEQLSQFSQFFTNFIQNYGYFAIFFLMLLESFNFPIPSEVIMLFGGYLAAENYLNIKIVILMGAIGNLGGSLLSYFLAQWILNLRLKSKWVSKILKEHYLNQAHLWFQKYGIYSVGLGRIIPFIRTFISLPAGIAKLPLFKFITYTFFGSLLWSAFLGYLGFNLKNNWELIYLFFRKLENFFIIIIVIFILFFGIKLILKKSKHKSP